MFLCLQSLPPTRKMRLASKIALFVALAVFCVGYQEPQGNETCNNYRANAHKCDCGRASMCGIGGTGSGDPDAYAEGPHKRQKACRKDLCRCQSKCSSRGIK